MQASSSNRSGALSCSAPPVHSPHADEKGFALILTIFIVTLTTIIVLDFASETLAYQRTSRMYSERIQADYILKSAINLAQVLLEVPKAEGVREDWLGEPWALISAVQTLPIAGLPGEPEVRLQITDESGKINLNSIYSGNGLAGGLGGQPGFMTPNDPSLIGGQPSGQGLIDPTSTWKNALRMLFQQRGIVRESYDSKKLRTLGDRGFDADDQVAVIHDWIDPDSQSHISAEFPGNGLESSADKTWFYNRQFRTLSELPLVPGMTLERSARIGPYVRAGRNTASRINVNTAPLEVLIAIGFSESQALRIVEERAKDPIGQDELALLVEGDQQLSRITTITSSEFTAYARVKMPNVERWAKAFISVSGGPGGSRRATVQSIEFM